jgi:hypothetical protein
MLTTYSSPDPHRAFMIGVRVNAKIGSGVRIKRHIDLDLYGFTGQTSSLQTFNSNTQNSNNEINAYLLLIQLWFKKYSQRKRKQNYRKNNWDCHLKGS